MCTCCDLSIVLAQTASRVDSEPVINKYRLKQSELEKLVKIAQHIKTALLTRNAKCLCLCLWRRTQYKFAPCSWGLERSAGSTQRSHACRCGVSHATVGPGRTQQLRSHGHFEQSERESLLWQAQHVHASQCRCIGLATRGAISSRVCCRKCIACANSDATNHGTGIAS